MSHAKTFAATRKLAALARGRDAGQVVAAVTLSLIVYHNGSATARAAAGKPAFSPV